MLITLSRRTAICQSVAEVYLTGVAPLGAVSLRFNFFKIGNVWNEISVKMKLRKTELYSPYSLLGSFDVACSHRNPVFVGSRSG